jgi:uncharacterized protein YwqG
MWWSRDTGTLDDRIRKRARTGRDQIKQAPETAYVSRHTRARESAIPLGASKLGGQADLPESMEWPGGDSTPMSFLRRINNEDLPTSRAVGLAR